MLINAIPYNRHIADSIINHIPLNVAKGQFCEAWYMREYHMVKHYGLSAKQIFKKVFGRQQICVMGWYRNWVWTFSTEGCYSTIYCMVDIRGVHWEMDIGSDLRGVIALREEIEKRLIA